MRPIKLTLQAFGPFAGEVVLDFRPALDQRLFGIYGPTGSGKSSILDGLCFALFGQSSGEERLATQLRSDHAAGDLPTSVSLIFEVGAKRYYIQRNPAQTVLGRGDRPVDRVHTANLFDVTDIPIDEVGPDNCGQVLTERKAGQADDKIEELLGYSADQFRQVVLLPQGKFRKLLTASSRERSDILRGLFDVGVYSRFAEKLRSEAETLKTDVDAAEKLIVARLGEQSMTSRDQLETQIEAGKDLITEIASAKLQADAALNAANTAFEDGKQKTEQFAQLALAQDNLIKLQALNPQIDVQRNRAKIALQAQAVQPFAEEAGRASAAAAQARLKLRERTELEAIATAKLEAAKAELSRSQAAEPQRKALSAESLRLEAILRRIGAAAPLKEALDAAQAVEAKAKKSEQIALTAVEAASLVKAKARLAYDTAILQATETVQLTSQLRDLGIEQKGAADYQSSLTQLTALQSTAASAKSAHATKRTAVSVARAALAEAERILAEAQAAHLAAKLEDGTPCPVCGSENHPNLASGDILTAGRDNAFREATEALQEVEGQERSAHDRMVGADAKLEAQKQSHEGRTAPSRPIDVINDELLLTQGRLDKLKLTPSKEALSIALTAAETSERSATEALTQASKVLATTITSTASAQASLQNELSTVPEELRSFEAANSAHQRAKNAETDAVQGHGKVVDLEQTARANAALEANNLSNARENVSTADKQEQEAQLRFEQALSKANLTSDQYETARADIASIAGLQAEVAAHDTACQVANTRLSLAKDAVLGIEQPDVEVLESARLQASQLHQQIVQSGADAQARLTSLTQLQHAILASEALIITKRERFKVVGEISNLSSGRNDKRLLLQDFAIMATFEDVLEAANLRFEKMTRDRYSLTRKVELARQGAVSGLEIQVYDSQTEKVRDAGTVSGGEGFLASLALALGLSDVIQSQAGGIKLDAIFIDEGFDQLDSDTLDLALSTLGDLVASDRAIGMISHVDAVKEAIPAAFQLRHGTKGSVLEPQLGLMG